MADSVMPDPLRLIDVAAIALDNRVEVLAAKARADALAQRPAIVSALEDPMISASIDHYPYENPIDLPPSAIPISWREVQGVAG